MVAVVDGFLVDEVEVFLTLLVSAGLLVVVIVSFFEAQETKNAMARKAVTGRRR